MSVQGSGLTKPADFGAEIAKIMPRIIREVAKMQIGVITKGILSVPQIVTLELLAEKGSLRMGELSRALGLTMGAVTAIIDKMVRLKLVRRERLAEDRRVVKVALMDKGRQNAKQITQERREATNRLFSALSQQEKDAYLRLLRKVHSKIG